MKKKDTAPGLHNRHLRTGGNKGRHADAAFWKGYQQGTGRASGRKEVNSACSRYLYRIR